MKLLLLVLLAHLFLHCWQEALEHMTGATFDSCLLNLYRDGGDHMGWHSDNERLYGRQPTIGEPALTMSH